MAATAHTTPLVALDEFPTLTHTGVAYLDSGATSQTPRVVLDAMSSYYETTRASVHRGYLRHVFSSREDERSTLTAGEPNRSKV